MKQCRNKQNLKEEVTPKFVNGEIRSIIGQQAKAVLRKRQNSESDGSVTMKERILPPWNNVERDKLSTMK